MTFRSAVTQEERQSGLEDLSPKIRSLRVQGPNAVSWLAGRDVICPETLLAVDRSAGLLVARVGSGDVVLQGDAADEAIVALGGTLATTSDVFQVPEQAATFRLAGPRAEEVWRQTCAVRLAKEPCDRIVYTRVAGISCAVIPEEVSGERSYRVWVDYSYAKALWQDLAEILAN